MIPKLFRDRLHLRPGDRVTFFLEGDGVRVTPLRSEGTMKGRFAGLALVEALEDDRRQEPNR